MIAYIGLGSNLDDRLEHLRRAYRAINQPTLGRIVNSSSVYASAPWGDALQADFFNAVLAVETHLDAHALLDQLHRIEAQLGRVRDPERRYGPRTIDLDLIDFGGSVIADARLTLPHPRAIERRFVIEPLAEIAPAHPLIGRAQLNDSSLKLVVNSDQLLKS